MNTITIVFEDKEIDYILSGCFEGGSTYWIKSQNVVNNDYKGAEFASEAVSKGAIVSILDGEENKRYELTKEKILKGIELYAKDNGGIDFDSLDAGDYDNILQFALFGNVVYG